MSNSKPNTDLYEKTLAMIEALQNIQKQNAHSSEAWQNASRDLQPLFNTMVALQNETKVSSKNA